jgi:hypothetical protein
MKSDALTPDRLAPILSGASGLVVTPEMITADVAAGAPTEADGSINLVRYVAWLLKQLADE